MARFGVYRLVPEAALALDVQADLLSDLDTRTMVPLLPLGDLSRTFARLNPVFEIDGQSYVMATQFIAVVPARELGPLVIDLRIKADMITAATDFLFQGF